MPPNIKNSINNEAYAQKTFRKYKKNQFYNFLYSYDDFKNELKKK